MSANLVANVFYSGSLTGSNVATKGVCMYSNPETLTSSGAMDPYRPSVLRPAGGATQYLGAMSFVGTTSTFSIIKSTTDSNGNIYFTGKLRSTSTVSIYNLTANPNTSYSGYNLPNTSNNEHAYLIKFNSAGIYQFSTSTFSDSNRVPDVAVDSSGNIYWAGTDIKSQVDGTIYNLTANPNTVSSGYSVTGGGMYILKYNSSGTYVSSLKSYSGTNSFCAAVACDSLGNVYMAGRYEGSGTILYKFAVSPVGTTSGYTLPDTSTQDSFLVKYDSSGNYVSALTIPGSFSGQTYAGSYPIVCDSSNNVYWAGVYVGTPTIYNLAPSPNSSSSGYSLPTHSSSNNPGTAIIKYNSSGTYQYSTDLGVGYFQAGMWPVSSLACDASGNLVIGSYFCVSATIYNMTANPGTVSTGYSIPSSGGGASGGLILKYSSTGTYLGGARTYATSPYTSGTGAVKCDSLGNVYWSGTYASGLVIYNLTQTIDGSNSGYALPGPSNQQRPFLIVYNSSGTYLYSAYFGYTSYGSVCSVDSNGTINWLSGTGNPSTIYNLTASPNTSSSGYSLTNALGFFIKYSIQSVSMTLANLGTGVTNIIRKPIYVKSGVSTTVTEGSNTWTIPASSNLATATWTTDRWAVTWTTN